MSAARFLFLASALGALGVLGACGGGAPKDGSARAVQPPPPSARPQADAKPKARSVFVGCTKRSGDEFLKLSCDGTNVIFTRVENTGALDEAALRQAETDFIVGLREARVQVNEISGESITGPRGDVDARGIEVTTAKGAQARGIVVALSVERTEVVVVACFRARDASGPTCGDVVVELLNDGLAGLPR